MSNTPGQMAWLSRFGDDGEKILHLRSNPSESWLPYTASPHKVPDYPVPGGSKGWATYQKLMRAEWTLVDSDKAQRRSDEVEA